MPRYTQSPTINFRTPPFPHPPRKMNGTTGSQEAGQFAGDTPLTGHNIQGHSINVMLVRDMPAEVVRHYPYKNVYLETHSHHS